MNERNPLAVTASESKKRKREKTLAVCLGVFFLLLTWFEIRLFGISQELPLVHSVFFFGLVNFNIVVLLLLSFLLFRNIVKAFSEKQGSFLGSSLKSKLIVAFLSFSLVPTLLMFFVSVFYINSSFDKWFSAKISSLLRSSIEVTNEFYSTTKKRNYHYANKIAEELNPGSDILVSGNDQFQRFLEKAREKYRLDIIEFYDSERSLRTVVVDNQLQSFNVPSVSQSFLKKGVQERLEASTIQNFSEGSLVRVIVPFGPKDYKAAIVVTTWIPLSLISRMDNVAAAYEEFKDLNPLEYPIKSIYLIILVMMTLVILLSVSWVGFYLARQLSVPLELLGKATRRLSERHFEKVKVVSGSREVNELIHNFNSMTDELERSEKDLRTANDNLKEALDVLDEKNHYIKVVLSNVSTGVIAVDQNGDITMINPYASQLLQIDSESVIGQPAKDVLSKEYYRIFIDLLRSMKKHKAMTLQKEFRPKIGGRSIPLQMKISLLRDDQGNDIGQVLVFDDLSMVINAQRAIAWREVARRIAHEIKNPLTPIKLSAQRLQKKFGSEISDKAFHHATSMIVDEVDGLKKLVNEFSNFARLPEIQPTFADLNQLIVDVVKFYEVGHKDCNFVIELDGKLPQMEFDPEQIRRVLNNLFENAIAAITHQKDKQIKISTNFDKVLKIAQIKVIDNGPEVKDMLIDKFFEPYFSTKESGTGLGLSIVKRIIEDHNGFVRATKVEPHGIQFLLELPVIVEQSTWKSTQMNESSI